MSDELERRAYRLFSDLLPLSEGERAERLGRLGEGEDGDPEDLRAAVEALLAADSEPSGPLDGTAEWHDPEWSSSPESPARPAAAPGGIVRPADLEPGSILAGYRLRRLLGEGGMGRVFEARRADGTLDRKVAIKVLASGALESERRVRRFLDEGRALARLQHANIARVFEAGVAPGQESQPYLVMESVDGVAITEHCRRADLDLEQRVDLFVSVCDAVQAAHDRRIVHRDLKPSNILVDERGTAKLLDFGIAAFLDRPELERTTHLLLTPAYAAPEQIRGETITPATDVYVLGLLLYELLTGQRALELEGANLPEIYHRICETDPAPPSMAFGERPSSRPLQELKQRLRGDLDTIVLEALRKAPKERYVNAGELARDLRRWREGRPIAARPVGWPTRLAKLVRRHPLASAALAAVVATLLASAVVMDQQRRNADAQRAIAERETARASQVSDLVRWLFEASDPSQALAADAPAVDLLASGAERVAEMEPAELRAELTGVLSRAYLELGYPEEAQALLRRVLARERAAGETVDLTVLENALRRLERAP